MTLVPDAHDQVGIRPGARRTGPELVAKMDAAAGIAKAVVFPFVEGNFTNGSAVR